MTITDARTHAVIGGCIVAILLFGGVRLAHAASLSVSPGGGTFTVGSTFEVSLFLNTEGQTVNALEAVLSFPSDKLQLVSPAATNSIIELWTAPPRFNNERGRVELQGGIPGGLSVSNGLVIRLTFRVKTVGTAIVKYADTSRILLHDGRGTDVLRETSNAIYQLALPPPAGPTVAAETHADQSRWYPSANVLLRWAADEAVDVYSYVLNSEPVDLPDDIADGPRTSMVYKNLSDGVYYFHIKAFRDGSWGGVTHHAVKVDTTPPAAFPIEVLPHTRTVRRQPIIQFTTSDALSGLDHYEVKLVPLKVPASADAAGASNQPFFVEAVSPYLPPHLDLGTYDIIVRAYDQAGNYREVTQHLAIVTSAFRIITDEGVEIRQTFVIPWRWLWGMGLAALLLLLFIGWRLHRWHHKVQQRRSNKVLPESVRKRLEELQRYRSRYGGALVLLFLVASVFVGPAVRAQQVESSPPLVTTISRSIANDEIFYAGGKTQIPKTDVIIYLQNLQDGQTLSQAMTSDGNGDWFYRHSGFLSSGNYLLWVQGKVGQQLSPPSPQIQMTVRQTALQFGSSRISYETWYLGSTVGLLAGFLGAIGYIVFHGYQARKKHRHFLTEVREAEESVRRGFAVLRRDIAAELAVIRRVKLSQELSAEGKMKEEQLFKDLAWAEQYIGKEIWEVEEVER